MPQITDDIDAVAGRLSAGKLVAIPTETVYGLAADARCDEAVARIFALKGRPASHPLIVHLADAKHLDEFACQMPVPALRLADAFMPGPLTLLLPRRSQVASRAAAGGRLIGLRVPQHKQARQIIDQAGGALAAPSANRFGRISPTSAAHVAAEFPDADDLLIFDGGECQIGIESTIVRVEAERIAIVRPGAIGRMQLSDVAGCEVNSQVGASDAPAAPGTLASHYRPQQPLHMAGRREIETRTADVALIDFAATRPDDRNKLRFGLGREPQAAARNFYARLREAEASGCRSIMVAAPPAGDEWEAVRDRLSRACQKG